MAQIIRELDKKENEQIFSNSLPVELSRVFQAAVEQVWKAWTEVDLIKQWWGPKDFSCPDARIDFREGGKYNFAMQGPDGKVIWSGGVFEEIIPYQKIAYTDSFTDKNGKVVSSSEYGMPGEWPEALYVTLTFEKLGDGSTKMHLYHEGIPKEMHDDCVEGWSQSIDKMQRLVERS